MAKFLDEHAKLLKHLVNHNVQFIVVGGYAVIHYGYERMTGDLDLWISKNNANRNRLIAALNDFGIQSEDLDSLEKIDFNNQVGLISLGEKPQQIEFLTMVNNVQFNDAYKERTTITLDGFLVPIIKLEHLILSKINTGRLKDQADIEELQRINKFRK